MIKIYGASWCAPCKAAKELLDSLSLNYDWIDVEQAQMTREDLLKTTGALTVPRIIINDECIGGYSELVELARNNKIQELVGVE